MLSRDANQSRICSSQTLGSPKTSNFGADNDNTEIMFSHHGEDELKVMLSRFPHHMRPEFDKWIRIFVKEEIESSHKNEAMHITRRSNSFVLRNLELRITNITSPLLTGDHIEGIGGMPVIVTLVDSHSKEEVKSGPEASGKVEIVVTEAEVENEFECKLVSHMDGKKMYHVNRLPLKLLKGTAVLPRVSFAHTKDWMNMSTIRLQARFVDNFDGVHVEEAYTEPFRLKDRRTKVYCKHEIPSLTDPIYRLKLIPFGGDCFDALTKAHIKTVMDLLTIHAINPQWLGEILKVCPKKWRTIMNHAKMCKDDNGIHLYYYPQDGQNSNGVAFNIHGQLVGIIAESQFVPCDKLPNDQRAEAEKLIVSSSEHWDKIVPFSDHNALISHLQLHTPVSPSPHNNLNVVIPQTSDPQNYTNLTSPKSQSPKRPASELISNSSKQARYDRPSVGMDTSNVNNLELPLDDEHDYLKYLNMDLRDGRWKIVWCAVGWISIILQVRRRR